MNRPLVGQQQLPHHPTQLRDLAPDMHTGHQQGLPLASLDVDRLRATKGPGLGRVGELLWNCAPNTP